MVSNPHRIVCVKCRKLDAGTPCNACGGDTVLVHSQWRAPKKTNDRAWKRVENGEWLWDRNHIDWKSRHNKIKRLRSRLQRLLRLVGDEKVDQEKIKTNIERVERELDQI